jgi:hypothetical protein
MLRRLRKISLNPAISPHEVIPDIDRRIGGLDTLSRSPLNRRSATRSVFSARSRLTADLACQIQRFGVVSMTLHSTGKR